MSNKHKKNKNKLSTQLVFPADFNQTEQMYFQKLHQELSPMGENELNITGVKLTITDTQSIKVMAFIRSTLEKPLLIEAAQITLLDKNLQPFAEKNKVFTTIDTLIPKTAHIITIEFSKSEIFAEKPDFELLESWSIAFKQDIQSQHSIDFSDLDEDKISAETKDWLNKMNQKTPLGENELSFMGFSAKQDKENRLLVNLLIRNGTKDNLTIKQLPLKFYDASGDLAAKGTFKMDNVTVRANTSKPLALVFPVSSILKEKLDLSSWKLVSHE